MGAKNSKGSFDREAAARQSQKKTYSKFRKSIGKLTKEVNKVKFQNKEKLLELEIAIKSAANDLEISGNNSEEEFMDVFEDFLKKCEELDKIVKEKLIKNDKSLEENIEAPTVYNAVVNTVTNFINADNAVFAEDISPPPTDSNTKKDKKKSTDDQPKKTKKKDKKQTTEDSTPAVEGELDNLRQSNQVDTNINGDNTITSIPARTEGEDQLGIGKEVAKKDKKKKKTKTSFNDAGDLTSTHEFDKPTKRKFWSFPLRRKRSVAKPSLDQIIVIQDPENERRSVQNIEINMLQKAITTKKEKRRSKFFDDLPATPATTPTPQEEPQQDCMQQIHNIRMSITTLEEMTQIYRSTQRGNYDYIYDNLSLCVNKLKDMENDGMLTLRHEKKRAMQQAQECLDVLEGRADVPDSYDKKPIIVTRTPSKKRDIIHQKSVEFIDITDNDAVIDFTNDNVETYKDNDKSDNLSHVSTDFSDDDDLKDILMSLQDSSEDVRKEVIAEKPVLITSF